MPISLTSSILADLRILHSDIKFNETDSYFGAPTEEIRQICESRVNAFIEAVTEKLKRGAEPEDVFHLARKLVVEFEEEEELDEAERAEDYIIEVMTILEIEDWEEEV